MSRTYPQLLWSFWKLVKFGFFIFTVGIIVGVAIDKVWYWTNWWQQLGTFALQFHLVNPWFFLIYAGFGTVAVLYYRFERGKKRKQQKQRKLLAEHGLALLNEERK